MEQNIEVNVTNELNDSVLDICLKLQCHGIALEYLTEKLSYSEAVLAIRELNMNPDEFLPSVE